MCEFFKAFFDLVGLFFEFPCHFFRMLHLVYRIFLLQDTPELDQRSNSKYPSYYPIQDILVVTDRICNKQTTEYEQTVSDKSTDAYSKYIGIVMIRARQQHFFCK